MRKAVITMLFVLSTTLIHAQKPKESSKLEKLNLKPIEFVFDEQVGKIDKESRAVRVNWNESFKSEAREVSEIALSYLREKKDVYGLSNISDNVKVAKIIESPSGKYVYYQQYVNDIPVFATNFIVYVNKEDVVTYALNEFRNIAKYRDVTNKPSVNINDALKTANEYLNITGDVIDEPKTELVYFESIDKGLELAWKINVISMEPMGDWQIFINAIDKHIIHVENIARDIDVNAKIFNPNPITTAQTVYGSTSNYKDNNNATNASLDAELKTVVLSNIKYENGLYKLEGTYCKIEDIEAPYGHNLNPVITTLGGVTGFNYNRSQTEFEAIMCYYHVDVAGKRIAQLGYNISGLNALRTDPHGYNGADNSHYVSSGNYLAFGDGGVDDAEDADIIWHEYAHAIQNNFTPAGMSYSNATGTWSLQEGSSDYWAISYKRSISSYNWGLFSNWDGHNEFWDGRSANLNWVYPTDYVGYHDGGQIWSSALMKIWGDLGRDITDQLFLESHLIWGYSPSMRDAATAFMKADLNLYNGSHLCQIVSRFKEHGLTDIINFTTVNFINQTVTANKTIKNCAGNINVQNVKVQNGAKLILDAAGEVNIISDFDVDLGSEFEIK